MNKNAIYGQPSNLTITDSERSTAKEVKENFKEILKKLDKSVKVILDLKDAITQQRPSKGDLAGKYKGRLLRYGRKIKESFNDFLLSTKSGIEQLSGITDPNMMRLKEILLAEVGELSDGAEAVLDLLKEPDKEGFTQTLERVCFQIEKRNKSIKDVVDNQLFAHINQDILGKTKISELRFNIRRGSRILKILARR
ncbi:MAG: hypothetical protein WC523_00755 [Patescibacteria group bacterium]